MMRTDPGAGKNLESHPTRGCPGRQAPGPALHAKPGTLKNMILDSLPRASAYRALGPRLAAGLEYLAGFDPLTAPGRYLLDGEDLFALVDAYDTGPATDKRFESHLRYIDIQFLASGRERILHAPADSLHVETPYDDEKDVAFYLDPPASSSFLLLPGDFAVFFPTDGHKPGCMAGGRDPVRKVVVKVRV
jgi:YhcH/YjgK/YiaL family protein